MRTVLILIFSLLGIGFLALAIIGPKTDLGNLNEQTADAWNAFVEWYQDFDERTTADYTWGEDELNNESTLGTGLTKKEEEPDTSPTPYDQTYTNSALGYSLTYPGHLLIPTSPSTKGEGQVFEANNGVKLELYAEQDKTARSVDNVSGGATNYSTNSSSSTSYSTTTKNKIYQREFPLDGLRIKIWLSYPKADAEEWEKIIKNIEKSIEINNGLIPPSI